MTTKKSRKPLGDALAHEFVYGKPGDEPELAENPELDGAPTETVPTETVPTKTAPAKKQTKRKDLDLMFKLELPAKEPTIRFTVDLSESKHRKLSILAAKTGRKKADLVRLALDGLLEQMESDEE